MVDPDIVLTVSAVAYALDGLGVDWAVGGSVASSVYGEPRATNSIDIVAALLESHVDGMLGALGPSFHADARTVMTAVRTHDSFNLIDERTFLKVDIFVPRSGPIGSGQLDRRRRRNLGDQLSVFVLGPEDTILQKLRWFRLGGEVSERQWRDIVAVLRLSPELDEAYRPSDGVRVSVGPERGLVIMANAADSGFASCWPAGSRVIGARAARGGHWRHAPAHAAAAAHGQADEPIDLDTVPHVLDRVLGAHPGTDPRPTVASLRVEPGDTLLFMNGSMQRGRAHVTVSAAQAADRDASPERAASIFVALLIASCLRCRCGIAARSPLRASA